MKITVEANSFCPDECPHLHINKIEIRGFDNSLESADYRCFNEEICENAVRAYLEQKRKEQRKWQ